jgi:two-component system chemotaxis response regulator CheB
MRPDVVTLDMVMPRMSGLECTEEIMAFWPTPILIVSSSTNRGELFSTYDALAAGAVDVFEKPRGDESNEDWASRLRNLVRLVSRIRVITHPRARLRRDRSAIDAPLGGETLEQGKSDAPRLVVVGASTGGPSALACVLGGLQRDFPLPVLVVLHLAAPFSLAFADWLERQIQLPVRHARDGEPLPQPGEAVVLLAPAEVHLELVGGRLRLGHGPERHFCRPSVDVLFESVARDCGARAIACLLTGMGRDGARGMLAIRNAGGFTLAQDEATSTIFGMPAEAIRLGGASRVLPLEVLSTAIANAARQGAP